MKCLKLKKYICLLCILAAAVLAAVPAFAAKKCPYCGGAMEEEQMPDGSATCTEGGTRYYFCTVCGEGTVEKSDPLGHKYRTVSSKAPTCTEDGFEKLRCTRCGKTGTHTLPATGHDYVHTVTEPTCTEDGANVYTCSVCGDSYSEPIPATGHAYCVTVTEPTCTEDGANVYTCSVCGDSYSEPIPATGHAYSVTVTEPTCTDIGANIYTCSVCGDGYAEPIVPPGHTYEHTVTEPTCTADGANVYTCAVCGDSYSEPIPALGHKYEQTVTEPTCTEDGENVYTCSVCGDSYSEPVAATGHAYGGWTVAEEPSLFREGREARTCARCGDTESRVLEKKPGGGWVVGGGAAAVAAGVFFGIAEARAGRAAAKAAVSAVSEAAAETAETAAETAAEGAGLGAPAVKMKKILLSLQPTAENTAFEALLRKQVCFKVFTAPCGDPAALAAAVTLRSPDVAIVSASSGEEAEALLTAAHTASPEQNVAVLGEKGMDPESLRRLKDGKVAFSAAMHSDSAEQKLVRLAMVVYRPDAAVGDYLSNLTLITDALGLGFVSTLINAYGVKGDIGELIANHGPESVSGAADQLNDIAGLFGFGALADLADRVRIAADQLGRNRKDHN